ncbi:sugar-binding protein [Thalassotalea ponticola]|uniref:sugar-binding protein n=1 Tax=Thalassotalea ponticola TaxID=1523392 RepID=UPI0025B29501|nr:sugar-binding protein [Thalassotalea ponticola]MDN3651592.1 sugar-binding protein [Thalassotalea ponticola]
MNKTCSGKRLGKLCRRPIVTVSKTQFDVLINTVLARLKLVSTVCLSMTVLSLVSTQAIAKSAEGFVALYSEQTIQIDGNASEVIWQSSQWYQLNHDMLANYPATDDFSGRFKVAWDENYLYLWVEMSDDVLFDQHANPLFKYWDDDALEVFIDEDRSGGTHQYDHNAFAYHIALDHQAIDIAGKKDDGTPNFVALNEHVKSVWRRTDVRANGIVWEVALEIHNDSFDHRVTANRQASRVALTAGKVLGFMLAYCDNDGSKQREHFLGSTYITPVNGDQNLGYKTADVFSTLLLKK